MTHNFINTFNITTTHPKHQNTFLKIHILRKSDIQPNQCVLLIFMARFGGAKILVYIYIDVSCSPART